MLCAPEPVVPRRTRTAAALLRRTTPTDAPWLLLPSGRLGTGPCTKRPLTPVPAMSRQAAVSPAELAHPSFSPARPVPTHANPDRRPTHLPHAGGVLFEAASARRNLATDRRALTCRASFQPVSIDE